MGNVFAALFANAGGHDMAPIRCAFVEFAIANGMALQVIVDAHTHYKYIAWEKSASSLLVAALGGGIS